MDSPTPSPAETFAARLGALLIGLRAVLGLWGLDGAVTVAFSNRAGWAFARIARMLVRFRAGKLRQGSPRATRTATPRRKVIVLPRRFGWLVQEGKHQAAGIACQLEHLLAEPEMAALLDAAPQARQILRPVCRALAIALPWTVTPPRPRKPRKPRPKPEPYRTPFPRGAITAARRYKALEKAIKRRDELAATLFRPVTDRRPYWG